MFEFGDDPSDAEVLRKVSDLLRKQFPSAGHWRELVSERLERMAENFDQGHLAYISVPLSEKKWKSRDENEAYRTKLQAQESSSQPKLEVPSISGWSPPILFDVNRGEHRLVAQRDVDELQAAAREWGALMARGSTHRATLDSNRKPIAEKVLNEEINHEHANQ